jgi:RHS repeat-associated protein
VPWQERAYFFGKKLFVTEDNVGSALASSPSSRSFYPYGEPKSGTAATEQYAFATYWEDSETGLDYAMNRYYSSALGRFLSPDPYNGSMVPAYPQSFNRYSYVLNDPIRANDRAGLDVDCEGGEYAVCSDTDGGDGSGGDPNVYQPSGGVPTFQSNPPPAVPDPDGMDPYDYAAFAASLGGGATRTGGSSGLAGVTISQGSTVFERAYDTLMNLLAEFDVEFRFVLSAPCEQDLAAVGVSDSEITAASLNTNILYGLATVSNYAQDVYGNTPLSAAAAAEYGSETMVQYMVYNPATAAVAQLNGNNIYINPAWVNGMSTQQQEGMLLHEMVHNITGMTDPAIQSALNISTTQASQNISDKLMTDCF